MAKVVTASGLADSSYEIYSMRETDDEHPYSDKFHKLFTLNLELKLY